MSIHTPPPDIPRPQGRPQGTHVHFCPQCGNPWEHDDEPYRCVYMEYFDCPKCRGEKT